jgi:P-type Ca2+ transporter type 2C
MFSVNTSYPVTGLTDAQVLQARTLHGRNEMNHSRESGFVDAFKEVVKEPMFLLLLAAATLYIIIGETGDALFMVFAIILVAGISLYQDSRSRNALAALKKLTQPTCKVIRNGKTVELAVEDVVLGDYIVVEEGGSVPADAIIIQSNDFSVNESILTGESLPVSKKENTVDNKVFQGTTVTGGLAICNVTAIGSNTELGKIGKSLETIEEEKTPLQIQVSGFVKKMALVGAIIFLIVWGINYLNSFDIADSLLKALTLAMSILPEEIPVAFTTFMALGAWRLMKMGIIVKQTKTVETLGSATVICTDKTGTITENRMSLAKVYVLETQTLASPDEGWGNAEKQLVTWAMWASEPIPFDPMEIALHEAYAKLSLPDLRQQYQMIHEYPLSGMPPMMTHVFENAGGERIIAAKGAPEALMAVSELSDREKEIIRAAAESLSNEGFRVLGVGVSDFSGDDFPKYQQDLKFACKGLVAFYDPPKQNMKAVFGSFYRAGIDVKIITGDHPATTSTIAKQTGFRGAHKTLNGEELMRLSDEALREKVMEVNIFTRTFPETKLKILNALKANGQVVAMTGDGVNDGPALKAAHIGIAMGKKGSEIARQASSLILTDDDLSRMVDAVAMGRKIYANLKKAIQYIISIHIPIILTVFIPLVLGWAYPAIFSPVHVIFLELIMGPTCSIIYENEPLEKNAMLQKPRPFTTTFFSWHELSTSIIQGLVITAGVLLVYQYGVQQQVGEAVTRTMVFVTLISANIFLTLVNRSFYFSILTTARYKNNLVLLIISITVLLMTSLLVVPSFTRFFRFESLSTYQLVVSAITGFISVIWYEGVKAMKRASD